MAEILLGRGWGARLRLRDECEEWVLDDRPDRGERRGSLSAETGRLTREEGRLDVFPRRRRGYPPASMPRCDHASFRVANLDRSIAFYEKVLPAALVSRSRHRDLWRTEIATLVPQGQDDFRLVLLMPRRVRWILALAHRLVPRQVRSHEHLGFACASKEELLERDAAARKLGARIANPMTEFTGKEGWLLEVHDPDGNAIEWTCGWVSRVQRPVEAPEDPA